MTVIKGVTPVTAQVTGTIKDLGGKKVAVPFWYSIHNVVLHQTMLHRLFGVAEVRLESAGGQKPEAQMRVLRLDEALALENLIKHRGQVAEIDPGERVTHRRERRWPYGRIER